MFSPGLRLRGMVLKKNTHIRECSLYGDADRCADELFYVSGAFGVVVYL